MTIAATTVSNTGTTTVSVSQPSPGWYSGSLLLATIVSYGTTTVPSTLSGWTQITSQTAGSGSSAVTMSVQYLKLTSAGASSYTFSTPGATNSTLVIAEYSQILANGVIDTYATNVSSTGGGITDTQPVPGSNTLTAGAGSDSALGPTSVSGGNVYQGSTALDLTNYTMTFDSNFSAGISLSANGPGTEWISNTDYGGNFGSGTFAQAPDSTAFVTNSNGLTLTAYKNGSGNWIEAFIGSEPYGFSQCSGGYFEIECKLPNGGMSGGNGVWPAWWLHGNPGANQVEIDIFEYYGFAGLFNTTFHLWTDGNDQLSSFSNGEPNTATVNLPTAGMENSQLNTFGLLIDQNWTTLFVNRIAYWSVPTVQEFLDQNLAMIVNVCVGGGWPVNVPSPLVMPVTYVRVWQKNGRFNA